MFDYSLEHLFSYEVSLERPQMIGPLPEGIRAIFYVTKGEVNGAETSWQDLTGWRRLAHGEDRWCRHP